MSSNMKLLAVMIQCRIAAIPSSVISMVPALEDEIRLDVDYFNAFQLILGRVILKICIFKLFAYFVVEYAFLALELQHSALTQKCAVLI